MVRVRVLAVADEVVEGLRTVDPAGWRAGPRTDVVLAAGDLPPDYLADLATQLDRPCVFVPGNHDADLSGFVRRRGMWTRAGFPVAWPGPAGGIAADGRVLDVAGLRIAGLGGSIRYRPGPHQYTEAQQARRVRALVRRAHHRRRRRPRTDDRLVDVLLTHSPPRGCGDREDPPHRGFACLHDAVDALRPALLVHGHVHPYGAPAPDRTLGATTVVNVVGHRVLDVPGADRAEATRGR